jgi:hypothetical protein
MRNSNTTALLVDLTTGKSETIQVGDIRTHFIGDVRGETVRQLSEETFLRKWTPVDPDPARRFAIFDAYSLPNLEAVDVPISAREGLGVNV